MNLFQWSSKVAATVCWLVSCGPCHFGQRLYLFNFRHLCYHHHGFALFVMLLLSWFMRCSFVSCQFSLSDILPSLSDISIRSSSDLSWCCWSSSEERFVDFSLFVSFCSKLSFSSFSCDADKLARFFVRSGVISWVDSLPCSWFACSVVLVCGAALSCSSCHCKCFSKFAQLN